MAKTTVELEPEDACVVFKPDGSVELHLPTMDDEDIVPSHVHEACRVAVPGFAGGDTDDE